ncbi:hypothetical protein [Aureibacter tunicatorum]|uniref:Uncharacterized protein n=1 Tax=Aureibacter tunicatorum TaxID=866807 RepID=A0AAE4BQ91_9BACT|nr:hypothetical protein [Aureibacter tunicatorum]MDR6238854.1 hypothetical protein [Aureibacter tunicatorum]BDD05219.1 hypothetical protein AUTU_27020 [Aureibacter tunicatorum]
MHNDPELNGKYLGKITKDFVQIADTLKEASYQIKKRGFSDYPIFVVSKVKQPLGQLLIGTEDIDIEWNFSASYLDEFLQRGIIDSKGEEAFKASYKDLDEFCCIFVVDNDFTKFIYIPYPEED